MFGEERKKSDDVYRKLEATLGRNVLFAQLDAAERQKLYDCVQLERFEAGATVIEQGDVKADHMYVVQEGQLEVYKRSGGSDTAAVKVSPICNLRTRVRTDALSRFINTALAVCLASWRSCTTHRVPPLCAL